MSRNSSLFITVASHVPTAGLDDAERPAALGQDLLGMAAVAAPAGRDRLGDVAEAIVDLAADRAAPGQRPLAGDHRRRSFAVSRKYSSARSRSLERNVAC